MTRPKVKLFVAFIALVTVGALSNPLGSKTKQTRVYHMKYIISTNKTIDQTVKDLEEAVARNKFGILHVHDLKATMKKKGIDFKPECRIFEVCNPQKAHMFWGQMHPLRGI